MYHPWITRSIPPPSAHFLGLEGGGIERIFSRSTKIPPKIGACGGLWKNDLKISIYTSITILPAQKQKMKFFKHQSHSLQITPHLFFWIFKFDFFIIFPKHQGGPLLFFQVTQLLKSDSKGPPLYFFN